MLKNWNSDCATVLKNKLESKRWILEFKIETGVWIAEFSIQGKNWNASSGIWNQQKEAGIKTVKSSNVTEELESIEESTNRIVIF